MGEVIRSYRDLRVWQEAMNLAEDAYFITKIFPKEELYGMTLQIRRASASIPANIAEGYGRKNRKEYIHFLYVAQGSLKELETHFLLSIRVKLASKDSFSKIMGQCELVGKILGALIRSLENKV